jgi:hypothetical protein
MKSGPRTAQGFSSKTCVPICCDDGYREIVVLAA